VRGKNDVGLGGGENGGGREGMRTGRKERVDRRGGQGAQKREWGRGERGVTEGGRKERRKE